MSACLEVLLRHYSPPAKGATRNTLPVKMAATAEQGSFFSGWPSRGDVCLRRNSSTPGKTKTQRTQDRRPPWRRRGRPPYGASRRPMPANGGSADSHYTAPPRTGRTRTEEGVEAEHRRPKWILHCKVKPPVNPCTFRVRRSNLNGLLDLHHCTSAPFNTIRR